MRMMKNNNNETVMVIGIDHGYGNMKTATRCFPSGVAKQVQWLFLMSSDWLFLLDSEWSIPPGSNNRLWNA